MSILPKINSPKDIKSLSFRELHLLAKEIRQKIIETVAKTGGHLAPSLGVVELTLALHKVFDSPYDKIIWDVGHQSYAHKLITGRRELFSTLRKLGGISGFPSPQESEYDSFGTGHASTSISAALGMAVARDLKGEKFNVIAVIGDGALTGGLAYEGLNQIGFMKKRVLIILNDNGMSISENVGGIATYLNRIVRTPVYTHLKKDAWELLGKLPPNLSKKAREVARKIKEGLKSFAIPTVLFEELGFRYIGPLDGHNLRVLVDNLRYVKKLDGPIFLHVITEKGKGYSYAVKNPSLFHGISPFDKETGKVEKTKIPPTYTEVFSDAVVELAKRNEKVVGITAAMKEGTGLYKLSETYPERFFDVGIAEEHAVIFAAGLAKEGYKPICAIYSTFLQRCFDQILHDVALQQLPVVFAIDRAGIVGEDGATHQGIFDLSYLRCIPNLVIAVPKDENELRDLLYTAVEYQKGPMAIRYPKARGVGIKLTSFKKIEIGKGEVMKEGKEGTILCLGPVVYSVLEVVKDINVKVVNMRFAKPLDRELLTSIKEKKIVTIEENTLVGGFSSGVLELLNDTRKKVEVKRIGIEDEFVTHGKREELINKYGLGRNKLRETIKSFITS